jgi:3-isopropylmalate/(R)-2-methylmalate dehydratase small subunit
MRPFNAVTGIAAPLLIDDINTDQITPAPTTRGLNPDYHAAWFAHWRLDPEGREVAGFVLNEPRYRDASILVVGRNFGCGSARESAVWAMMARGIRCIIARSFAPFYRANCIQNGVLPIVLTDRAEQFERLVQETAGRAPFTLDLQAETITTPAGEQFQFAIEPADRASLLAGLDDISATLKHAEDIARWEQDARTACPWMQAIPLPH